ncbi:chemotaxis protein CheA [Selenihalanaerobacter shriftii]|uniref:Chemotaxis protein CheA n=1 Tax=Selenihalanaerobacter shriftii TaxID=142842 RepID=A0A1T4KF31_9FIRM|nr:chemotaxis protein CheA [Selenihalanaerobacter shriftii]SJZ40953.1 two-component system, chemotaxis family, sensor kinase CheA [Selenihalanaerobacter shriftii]
MSDENLINIFIEEAEELLANLEIDLLQLESEPNNHDLINRIFRAMHTLKGSASLTGLDQIADFVHHAEDLLDRLRNGSLNINSEIINLLLESRDLVEDMVKSIIEPKYEFDVANVQEVSKSLQYFLGIDDEDEVVSHAKVKGSSIDEERVYKISLDFNSNLFVTGTDNLLLIRELSDLGEVLDRNINLTKIPDIYNLDPEECYIKLTLLIKTKEPIEKINDVFIFIEFDNKIEIEDITENFTQGLDLTLADKKTGEILVEKGILEEEDIQEALAKQKKIGDVLAEDGKVNKKQVESIVKEQQKSREIKAKSTVKVDTDKLEALMNSMAELIISQAKVRELALKNNVNSNMKLVTSLDEMDKRIHNLQEEIMKARMVPIGNTFLRFRRLVRDLSKEQGKEVDLEIKGKETELDKTVIEKIGDPLKHMIRNSIDHGIELPEVREENGKPRKGTITLNAYHQEGNIIIDVSDDGQGLDRDKILNKAVNQGVIEAEQNLTDDEVYQLICEPGFSTAQKVTETSGRGVGMDVVKSNIENLRGTINISSELGQGTTFKLKIPLTLAIIDGMVVKIGLDHFIIPLNSIVEFTQPLEQHVKTVKGKGEVIKIRNEYVTLTRLHKVLDIEAKEINPTKGILVIVQENGKKTCLLVDEILGQQQAVVKSLEDNYTYVEGMAGATILGDGNVAMILDVATILRMAVR